MWKPTLCALLLGSSLLVGCNNNGDEDAINDVGDGVKEGVEDVGEGVREGINDVRKGVDETLDNDTRNNDVDLNNDGINDGVQDNNGVLNNNDVIPDDKGVRGDERGNQEDVIEDARDIRDRDTKDE
ncbi:hypothetical protein [Ureibacillus sp. FSL W8-0352]|uniref:hypothetical protein n=1 Tax=Ureibacillus sp. FSL W8-0352 TaxID=2954596 RepID=UPI0030F6FF47